MTNSPPPDPRSSRTPLGFDEFLAVVLALAALGGILFWSLSRSGRGFQIPSILPLVTAPEARSPVALTPQPQASPEPRAELAPIPSPAPEAIAPETPVTPRRQPVAPFPAIVPVPTTPTTPASPEPSPAQQVKFQDVPADYWAYPFITALAERGIVRGFSGGYYKPTDPVTRAEYAAILQEAFNQLPGSDTQSKFTDVPENFWGIPAINRAIQLGFLRGYPDNTFKAQQEIPRAQVLVSLASGLNLAPPALPEQVLEKFYVDADQIPNYARERIAAATTAGLVVNYPEANQLRPNIKATRADVAASVYQALVRAGRLDPIQSPYIAGVQQQ
ncbi:S-layer protein [Chroococcidiopsis sp. CCALA 051]|uniref:S-layer homology domain-containing protein n=1 Tax=Chroococcidiopsis sp. CCALA 051 TaxID=869949 RepID=UPI000D0D20AF|nr:S-layer homology domain-containing protein [Chroococcidiopsis sp. CCALA 051]PSM46282.1 S-layer protein [Chroococcidiopsis sp. CCALA 051]